MHNAADYILADLNIKKISRVWSQTVPLFSRPNKLPRENEGLLFFESGDIGYEFGDQTFIAKAGQVLRLPSGVPYRGWEAGNEPHNIHIIDFETYGAREYLDYPLPFTFTPSEPKHVISAFSRMEEEWKSGKIAKRLNVKAQLYTLLSDLTSDYAASALNYNPSSLIIRITEYLHYRFQDKTLKIANIADYFHISETHLRRLFKSEIGASPIDYLVELRMEYAKQILTSDRTASIQEVADLCGYRSAYYFSTAFQQYTGYSPSKYRHMS